MRDPNNPLVGPTAMFLALISTLVSRGVVSREELVAHMRAQAEASPEYAEDIEAAITQVSLMGVPRQ